MRKYVSMEQTPRKGYVDKHLLPQAAIYNNTHNCAPQHPPPST